MTAVDSMTLDISHLAKMTMNQLMSTAKSLKIEGIGSLRKQDLIFKIY